jgi:hypothetical protein
MNPHKFKQIASSSFHYVAAYSQGKQVYRKPAQKNKSIFGVLSPRSFQQSRRFRYSRKTPHSSTRPVIRFKCRLKPYEWVALRRHLASRNGHHHRGKEY